MAQPLEPCCAAFPSTWAGYWIGSVEQPVLRTSAVMWDALQVPLNLLSYNTSAYIFNFSEALLLRIILEFSLWYSLHNKHSSHMRNMFHKGLEFIILTSKSTVQPYFSDHSCFALIRSVCYWSKILPAPRPHTALGLCGRHFRKSPWALGKSVLV